MDKRLDELFHLYIGYRTREILMGDLTEETNRTLMEIDDLIHERADEAFRTAHKE